MPFGIRIWWGRAPAAVALKGQAMEDRQRNIQERGRLNEGHRWENRLRLLVAELRSRGHVQAAMDLEEVVDELAAGKGR